MAHKQMVPSVYASLRRNQINAMRSRARWEDGRWDGRSDPTRKRVAQLHNAVYAHFKAKVDNSQWSETERLVADAVLVNDNIYTPLDDELSMDPQHNEPDYFEEVNQVPLVISEDPFGPELNCKCVLTDEVMLELKHEAQLAKRRERDRLRRANKAVMGDGKLA